jgi:hypothetical protein
MFIFVNNKAIGTSRGDRDPEASGFATFRAIRIIIAHVTETDQTTNLKTTEAQFILRSPNSKPEITNNPTGLDNTSFSKK